MTLDADKLKDSGKGFVALFFSSLRKEPGLWSQFVMNVGSTGKSNEYDWLGGPPKIEEWASGDRPMGSVKAYNYAVDNQKWANGLRVKREDIEDDNLGVYAPLIRQMASDFDLQKAELLFETLLLGAFTRACYDGQFMCDTDHLDNEESAQSNKATAELSTSSFETGIEAMPRFTDDRGKKLNIMATHLVVPPQLRSTALRIVGREVTREADSTDENAAGVSNINRGVVQVVVAPWLSAQAKYWFLADLSKDLKPYIHQTRTPVEFQALINPDDPNVFGQDEFHYGGRERYTIAEGAWQCLYGSDGTT
jgi:phage major head subunit gpT-like protein